MCLFSSIETMFESGQRLQNSISIGQWCLIWSQLHSGTVLIGLYYYVILSFYGCSSILQSLVHIGRIFQILTIFLNWRLNSFCGSSFGLCYSTFLVYGFIFTTWLPPFLLRNVLDKESPDANPTLYNYSFALSLTIIHNYTSRCCRRINDLILFW